MPKKTKKEKILAELHRKLARDILPQKNFVKGQIDTSLDTVSHINSSTYTYSNLGYVKAKNHIITHDYAYLKHDLLKISSFTILALLFQGVLYFFLRKG